MLSVNPWSTRLINDFSGIHAISVYVRQRPFCEWKMKSAKKTRTFEHSCLHWRPPLWKIKFINSINVLKIEQAGYNIRMEFPFGNTKIIKRRKHKRNSVTLLFRFSLHLQGPGLRRAVDRGELSTDKQSAKPWLAEEFQDWVILDEMRTHSFLGFSAIKVFLDLFLHFLNQRCLLFIIYVQSGHISQLLWRKCFLVQQ